MYISRILKEIGLKASKYSRQICSTSTIHSPVISKMADKKTYSGLKLQNIVEQLENFAPTTRAESWDNVGLLIDPMETKPITKILLTNDLTEDVMKEAIDLNIGMIVSYHPPIFKALKSFTSKNWKERIVIECLKHSIALYSPHTSWDIVDGGVNDWLSKSLSPKTIEPISESGAGRFCHLSEPLSVKIAIEKIKQHIGVPYLQLALAVGRNIESKISTIALCAGSGASILLGQKADLYLTGEMSHHEVLEANHNGAHVILCNHSNSERGFLRDFALILQDKLLQGNVQVIVSEKDSDPLKTV